MYATSPEDTALQALPQPPVRRAEDARRGVRTLVTRYFFGAVVLMAVLGALVFALLPMQATHATPAPHRVAVAVSYAVLALVALLAMRVPRAQVERAMFGVMVWCTLTIAATALAFGWGLATPGLGFYGLLVCLLCAATNRHYGLALAAICALAVTVIALAGRHAMPLQAAGAPGESLRLILMLLQIAVGLGAGLLISYVVARYIRSADDREARFRGLLAIAADAYWEIDQNYQLSAVSSQGEGQRSLSILEGLGRTPWEMPQFSCDGDTLDALLADLDSRARFRDRPVQWLGDDGRVHDFVLSGEPRFDPRGVFKGYWGVAREVTDELAARQALAATDSRYRELFARIPTPLVMHRDARVIDANPAALAMFGYSELAAMHGRDLLAAYESGDSRERARRRIEELLAMPNGTALPVADFRLQMRDGRRVSVRGTGVRVEADGGPAVLSIYVDDTERRNAEEAVRRSEAMLSHLVATSPDVITLTDLATGRYAMVNRTFERLVGYSAAEVIGRTSTELGIWAHPGDRERFVSLLQEHGAVSDVPAVFAAKDGHLAPMRVSGARFVMDRRDYLVINARDVSEAERHRLEREAILENSSIGIAVTRERAFVLANPHFEQMFGWPPGGLIGQSGRVVWPDDAAYADMGAAAGPALARGEQVEIERSMMRRDGSVFIGRILARAIDPRQATRGGTIWIIEDVTGRRQTEQALAAARDAAEAASHAKSAFLANTSHELRTPLNGMLHLAQLARDPALPAARRDQYLEQIADSAQSLADIISDILDLSKIEAGKLALEATAFDLGELLQAVQRAYATLASARDLALELDVGPGIAGSVLGDPLRVRQILSNFLSNALKFTAVGQVRIVARRGEGPAAERVRLEVHDSGAGINAETQARLFRPFTQADESTTRRFGGTGLGLSICRELATLMSGEVGVLSVPGDGSVFWAELPLPRCDASANAPSSPGAPARDISGARVLMVEDNPVNMMIAVALLERWGVQVEQATDGRQAVNAVERAAAAGQPFDAVLMDVQMPVMSGYEATRALRFLDAGRRLPIVALTAAALVSERSTAMEAGMDDFLTKPIDAGKLRQTLGRWVGRDA